MAIHLFQPESRLCKLWFLNDIHLFLLAVTSPDYNPACTLMNPRSMSSGCSSIVYLVQNCWQQVFLVYCVYESCVPLTIVITTNGHQKGASKKYCVSLKCFVFSLFPFTLCFEPATDSLFKHNPFRCM